MRLSPPPFRSPYEPLDFQRKDVDGWTVHNPPFSKDGGSHIGVNHHDGGPFFNPYISQRYATPDRVWSNGQSGHGQGSGPTNTSRSGAKGHSAQSWPQFLSSSRTSRTLLSSSQSISFTSLPAAATARTVILCCIWYATSALSSNTGKSIMIQFRYPVTLTFAQFAFVALYCLLCMTPAVGFSKLRLPSRAIIQSTLPMGMFQVGGHMFSSMAISRIPVSTVHTIKALSPLFTVAAYAILFRVSYSAKTYLSLLPLTVGVMLASTFDMSASNMTGVICAFGSAIIFVSSNIFFKKIMPTSIKGATHPSAHKLDKLNLLLYSSGMAFLLMVPIWLYYDFPVLLASSDGARVGHPTHGHATPHSLYYYFFINGTVHFGQNIVAFIILSATSPVTYSIASLIKRVAVICIAIMWFSQSVHPMQGLGIVLTFVGLWMYNNSKADVEKGESKVRRIEAARDMVLPSTKEEEDMMNDSESFQSAASTGTGIAAAHGRLRAGHHHPNYRHQALPAHPGHPYPPPTQGHKPAHGLRAQVPPPIQTVMTKPPVHSPIKSYPSPPPSVGSPPPTIISIPDDYRSEPAMQHTKS